MIQTHTHTHTHIRIRNPTNNFSYEKGILLIKNCNQHNLSVVSKGKQKQPVLVTVE